MSGLVSGHQAVAVIRAEAGGRGVREAREAGIEAGDREGRV